MNSKHLAKGARQPSPLRKGKVRLYSNRFCPYSQRVALVLDAKKVPYEIININLANKPHWLYEKTPNGKIPALELDSGDILYESLIISDYLDEKYRHMRLHPADPLRKAKDQLLLRQFAAIIQALLKTIHIGMIEKNEAEIISEGLTNFENELAQRSGPFFGNHKPGMLDYMIWPWCERSEILNKYGRDFLLDQSKYPKLMEWRKLMMEDEVVKKSLCDTDIHLKFLDSFKVGVPNYDLLL